MVNLLMIYHVNKLRRDDQSAIATNEIPPGNKYPLVRLSPRQLMAPPES